jgi:hypothetical protein
MYVAAILSTSPTPRYLQYNTTPPVEQLPHVSQVQIQQLRYSPSFKTLARLTLSVGVCGRTSEGRRGQPLQSLRSLRKQTFSEFIGFCGLQMGVRGGDFDVVGAPGRLSTIPFDF